MYLDLCWMAAGRPTCTGSLVALFAVIAEKYHATYTPATAPSKLSRGKKLRHQLSSSLHAGWGGIVESRPSLSGLRGQPKARACCLVVVVAARRSKKEYLLCGQVAFEDPYLRSFSLSAIRCSSVSAFTYVFSSRGFSYFFFALRILD
jgi:hypothetical protein